MNLNDFANWHWISIYISLFPALISLHVKAEEYSSYLSKREIQWLSFISLGDNNVMKCYYKVSNKTYYCESVSITEQQAKRFSEFLFSG